MKGLERELPTIYAPKRYTKRLQEDGNPLPEPSDYKSIKADEYDNGVVTLVPLDVGAYAEKYGSSNIEMGKNWYENIIFSFSYAIISM